MKKTHKRISAAVLSLALGFSVAGAPALAPMAVAQQSVFDLPANAVSTIIQPDEGATLTIEKYLGEATNGTIDLPGLQAYFTVEEVTHLTGESIDLTVLAGWEQVNDLIAAVELGDSAEDAVDNAELTLETIDTKRTEDDGTGLFTTTFTGLDVGVYLVTETVPYGHQGAAPFFVTLPSANTGGSGWNYDLTVQPKNQQDDLVEKTVRDELAGLGTVSTYTIEMDIPDDANLTSIRVQDELPFELGNLDNVQVHHTSVDDGNLIVPDIDGNSSTELDLTINNSAGPETLDRLRGGTLIVTFDAEIVNPPTHVEDEHQGGVIKNEANIELTIDGATYNYTTDPEDPTETRLGTLRIAKIDGDDNPIAVGTGATQDEIDAATAEFELWRCADTDTNDEWELGAGPLELIVDGTPTTVFKTDPTNNGIATIPNVQMVNFVNGTEITNYEQQGTMCAVETKAPAGYVLNPEPRPVLDANPTNFTMTAEVMNLADDGTGQLPATGGMGTMAMIAGGLLVAVAGGFAALRGNRARG